MSRAPDITTSQLAEVRLGQSARNCCTIARATSSASPPETEQQITPPTIAAAACAGVPTGPSAWSGSRSSHRVDPARSASAGRFAATPALTCAFPHPRALCSPPTYRRRHLGAIAWSSCLRRRLPCQAEGLTGGRSGHSQDQPLRVNTYTCRVVASVAELRQELVPFTSQLFRENWIGVDPGGRPCAH